jgi:hypothetical protein
MSKRYMGNEECTSPNQVVRYLTENFQSNEDGTLMPEDVARGLVQGASEEIMRAITVFRSHVDYVGDDVVNKAKAPYNWIDADEEDYEEDEDEDDE